MRAGTLGRRGLVLATTYWLTLGPVGAGPIFPALNGGGLFDDDFVLGDYVGVDFVDPVVGLIRGNGLTIGLTGSYRGNEIRLGLNNVFNLRQDVNFGVTADITTQITAHHQFMTVAAAHFNIVGGRGFQLNDLSLSVTGVGTLDEQPFSSSFLVRYDLREELLRADFTSDVLLDQAARYSFTAEDLLSRRARYISDLQLTKLTLFGDLEISGRERVILEEGEPPEVDIEYTGRLTGLPADRIVDALNIILSEEDRRRLGIEDIPLSGRTDLGFQLLGRGEAERVDAEGYLFRLGLVRVANPSALWLIGTGAIALIVLTVRRLGRGRPVWLHPLVPRPLPSRKSPDRRENRCAEGVPRGGVPSQ